MDNMSDIYVENVFNKGQVLTEEQSKNPTVGKDIRGGFEGEDKAKKGAMPDPFEKSGKPAKPAPGPSAESKPTKFGKKVAGMKDSTEQQADTKLSFDDLYRKTITEADEDIVPAADPESADFDEDVGDFTPPDGESTDIDEEIDLAQELRMLADRLNEIADKLSVEDENIGGDEDMGMGDEGAGDEFGQTGVGGEEVPPVANGAAGMGESVQRIAEAIKSEPTPKAAKKTTLGPRMTLNPKASGYTKKSGAGKAKVPTAGKDRTGTPSVLGATKFGPKMSQNPQGSGPAVKGSQAPLIA